MKRLLLVFVHISLCILLFNCNKKDSSVSTTSADNTGSIYGSITDYATGEHIRNANVQLRPTGETTLTGYDGTYEFLNIPNGDYSITVSKAEYSDLIDDYVIEVRDGRRMRRDVQIQKNISYIRLTDMTGQDITFLDFGSELYTTTRSFNVFNNGTVNIHCSIVYSCNWISSVSALPNTLSSGQNAIVNVAIDRTKLVYGENITTLYITSNNGSNALDIIATGQENLPEVLTLPVTNPDGTQGPLMNTFHADVINTGYPPYTKRGFCWSSTNSVPTIYDEMAEVPGSGAGEYSYEWQWDFFNPPTTPETYYVRAWVKYGSENTIKYGNVQSFIFNNF